MLCLSWFSYEDNLLGLGFRVQGHTYNEMLLYPDIITDHSDLYLDHEIMMPYATLVRAQP